MPVVFSFDIGLGSLGIAVRKDNDIIFTQSLLIDADVASIKEQAVKRSAKRTREAKKKRIKWLEDVWSNLRLDGLLTPQDERLKREFPKEENGSIVYTSSLLRIQLLQGKTLEPWQIYKAIRSSFIRRGYDEHILWKSENQNSKEANEKKSDYDKMLSKFEEDLRAMSTNIDYHFPCYYDAYKMGLWEPKTNQIIKLKADHEIKRARGYVASRYHVEKEIYHLLLKAGEALPQLKGQESYIMYGSAGNKFSIIYADLEEGEKASSKVLAKIRYASEKKHEGVLAQKKPRFDNRQVSKCCLIPRFQVCRADESLVIQVTYLMKLRNLSFFNENNQKTEKLNLDDMRFLFQKAKDKLTKKKNNKLKKNDSKIELNASDKALAFKLTKTQWKKWLEKTKPHCKIIAGNDEVAKANIVGRSRFSKPALVLMKDLLLSGESPHNFLKERINKLNSDSDQYKKFKLKEEDFNFLKRMENDWSKIHIPSISLAEKYLKKDDNKEKNIKMMISDCHDPIVRHRLTLFYKQLEELIKQYEEPDKIVMEFIREDFMGEKKKDKLIKFNKKREKENKETDKQLQEKLVEKTRQNKIKMRLFIQQGDQCLYTGELLSPSAFTHYEIDHIIPKEGGGYNGPDAIWNKVLTTRETNNGKSGKAPFEYISSAEWGSYVERVNKRKFSARTKKLLLARSRDEIEENLERYYGLAMTSWIARIARNIACLRLGWQPSEKGEIKQFHVISGGLTARIRRIYKLNSLLGKAKDEESGNKNPKKDRDDKRHHALDAMVLAYLSEYYRNEGTTSFFKFPKEIGEEKIDIKQYFEKEKIAVLRRNLVDYFVNWMNDQKWLKENLKDESKNIQEPLLQKFKENIIEQSENIIDLPIRKQIENFAKRDNFSPKNFKNFLEKINVKLYFEKKLSEVHPIKIARSKPALGDTIYGGIKHPQTNEKIAVLREDLVDYFVKCWRLNYLQLDQKEIKEKLEKESENITNLPIYQPIKNFIEQKNIELKDFKKYLEKLQHEGLQYFERKEDFTTLIQNLSDFYKQLLQKLKKQLKEQLSKKLTKQLSQKPQEKPKCEQYLPKEFKDFLEELQHFETKGEISTFRKELSDLYELLLQELKEKIIKRSENIIDLPIRKQIENFAERDNFSPKDFKNFLEHLRQSPEKGSYVKKIRVKAFRYSLSLEDKINLSKDKEKLSGIRGQYFESKTVTREGMKQHGYYFYRDDKDKIRRCPVRAFHSPYQRKQELKDQGYDILYNTLFYAGMLIEITEGSSAITKGIYTIQGFSNEQIEITNQKGIKSTKMINHLFKAGMKPYPSR